MLHKARPGNIVSRILGATAETFIVFYGLMGLFACYLVPSTHRHLSISKSFNQKIKIFPICLSFSSLSFGLRIVQDLSIELIHHLSILLVALFQKQISTIQDHAFYFARSIRLNKKMIKQGALYNRIETVSPYFSPLGNVNTPSPVRSPFSQ